MNINSLDIEDEYKIALKKLTTLGYHKTELIKDLIGVFSFDNDSNITHSLTRMQFLTKLSYVCFNKELKSMYANYLDSLLKSGKDITDYIDAYEYITSSKFHMSLVNINLSHTTLKQIKDELKKAIEKSKELNKVSFNIYRVVWNLVKYSHNKLNTKVPLYTEKNVLSTKEIENLKISSMQRFLEIFENITYFHKESASDSIILTGYLKSLSSVNAVKRMNIMSPTKQFYMKIFPDRKELNQLTIELNIYSELYKLIEHNITPNILCKALTIKFDHSDDFSELINKLVHKIYNYTPTKKLVTQEIVKKVIGKINENTGLDYDDNWDEFYMIMTHAGGPTLGDIFHSLKPLELKHVMFQIIYTLYVFDKLEISHGDLHSGNIFIITLDKPKIFCYKIGTGADAKYYEFTSDKLVKIYDFDHGIICESTNLESSRKFKIEEIWNPIRKIGEWANEGYAETTIYNSKLDIIIFVVWGLINKFSRKYTDKFNISPTNIEFNEFIKDVFRGFTSRSPYSNETIKDTYNDLANTFEYSTPMKEKNLRELNLIMNIPSDKPYNIDMYDISETSILSKTWINYLENILLNKYGRIVKKTTNTSHNHLWIPDEIVLNKWDILNHVYFNELLVSNLDIVNSHSYPIFSIDDKIKI